MIRGPWFVTAAAVEDYMELHGVDIDDAAAFHRHAAMLSAACKRATAEGCKPKRFINGGTAEVWQIREVIAGRSRRLELIVSLAQSGKGYSDQLIAVADRDARRPRQ